MQDGILGDLMENDAARAAAVEPEGLDQVPGDGLPLAVLIGSQPYELCVVRGLLEVGHDLLLVGGHDIFRLEPGGDVDAELLVLQVTDVAETGLDRIFLAQIFLDSLRLGRRLYDN